MKLQKAYLCIDCDEIFTLSRFDHSHCPSCQSLSFRPIQRWMDYVPTVNTETKGTERDELINGMEDKHDKR